MIKFVLLKKKTTVGQKTAFSDSQNHTLYLSQNEVAQLSNKEQITVTIE